MRWGPQVRIQRSSPRASRRREVSIAGRRRADPVGRGRFYEAISPSNTSARCSGDGVSCGRPGGGVGVRTAPASHRAGTRCGRGPRGPARRRARAADERAPRASEGVCPRGRGTLRRGAGAQPPAAAHQHPSRGRASSRPAGRRCVRGRDEPFVLVRRPDVLGARQGTARLGQRRSATDPGRGARLGVPEDWHASFLWRTSCMQTATRG